MHYDHLVTGELSAIRENGATSGAGVLATFGYDSLGRRTSLTRGNGAVTSYTYDAVSRLASQSEDLAGTSHDQSSTFTFNPAGQIASVSRSNDTYAFTGHANASRTDTHNGLNQVTASGSTGISHDARGNTDGIGSSVYVYDLDNRLRQASGGAVLNYDPLGRLTNSYDFNDIAGTIDYFARDGARIIGEAASGGGIARRYVHGEGLDEVLVQYEGSGTSDRRWLHADERGSIVAVSDGTGAATAVNRYDEYGNPQGGTISGRFGYTGQAWVPELGMWYYKARVYNPSEPGERFMQLDQTGYGDGMNGYVYVGGDPVNRVDPTGLWSDWVVTGTRIRRREPAAPRFNRDIVDAMARLGEIIQEDPPIVVTGKLTDDVEPCVVDPGTAFQDREAAGLAGVRRARAEQLKARDQNERFFRLRPLPGGRWTFSRLTVGNPGDVDMEFALNSGGGGHTHTSGDDGRLSNFYDRPYGPKDVENLLRAMDRLERLGADVSDFVTILGSPNNHNVYIWVGRDIRGEGRIIGRDTCP
jgi:RHS repeat-associated protein